MSYQDYCYQFLDVEPQGMSEEDEREEILCQYADLMHQFYCLRNHDGQDKDWCPWMAEECAELDPWALGEHYRWYNIAEKMMEARIPIVDALKARDSVVEKSRLSPPHN